MKYCNSVFILSLAILSSCQITNYQKLEDKVVYESKPEITIMDNRAFLSTPNIINTSSFWLQPTWEIKERKGGESLIIKMKVTSIEQPRKFEVPLCEQYYWWRNGEELESIIPEQQ